MQLEKLTNVYNVTTEFHSSVTNALNSLDDNSQKVYCLRRKKYKIVLAVVLLLLILSTTVVAASTEFFGLFSQRVGNYGLNITAETLSENENKTTVTNVTLDLGYLPDGYKESYGDETSKDIYKYYYGDNANDLRLTFFVSKTENFIFEEKYITDYYETEFDGYKTVFATRQFEDNSEEDYVSVKYFNDWGYVVTCYSKNYNELKNVTEHLKLKKATESSNHTTKSIQATDSLENYGFKTSNEYKILKIGETYDFSDTILNGENSTDFTITVKSVEERNSFTGMDRNCLLYDELYSQFFDDNGVLITPYTRTEIYGDGVDSLIEQKEVDDDRHFYVVTLAVTANTSERNDFQTSCFYVSKIDTNNESSIKPSQKSGEILLIYMTPDNSSKVSVDIQKDETKTFTIGVVADDDIVGNSCLTIRKRKIDIDHNNELATECIEYACVMLNSEVDYD